MDVKGPAYAAAAASAAVALVAAYQTARAWSAERIASRGAEFRKFFLTALALSSGTRAGYLYASTVYSTCDGSVAAWTSSLLNALPSILFFSTYSVLVLFWARIYYKAVGAVASRYLLPLYYFLNLFVYGAFVTLAIVTHTKSLYGSFRVYSLYIVGSAYILGGLSLVHFGTRILMSVSSRRFAVWSIRQAVLSRMIWINLLCTFLFLCRGIFALIFEVSVCDWTLSYVGVWNSGYFVLIELLPSAVVLWLLRHRSKKPRAATMDAASWRSPERFPPRVSTPDNRSERESLLSPDPDDDLPYEVGDNSDSDDDYVDGFGGFAPPPPPGFASPGGSIQ